VSEPRDEDLVGEICQTRAVTQPPSELVPTRERLIDAARREFEAHGYLGTNTNRIARAGGFSPQTFYRHFADKLEIFREVYTRWISESWRLIGDAIAAGGTRRVIATRIADVVVAHYTRAAQLRASVRMLAASDPSFRELYLAEARRQLEITRGNRRTRGQEVLPPEEHLAALLVVERFADALAFDEVAPVGIDPSSLRALMARFVERYLGDEPLVPESRS
jgi:AcrR family transcriptional regulator